MEHVNRQAGALYSALVSYEKEIASPRGKAVHRDDVGAGRLVLCNLFKKNATDIQPTLKRYEHNDIPENRSYAARQEAVIVAVRAGLQALSQQ